MQETGQKNSIPLSDEALALRFQNGDDAAFSELAARYLKVIRIKACSFREIFSGRPVPGGAFGAFRRGELL